MDINIGMIIAQIINFLILFFLFKKLLASKITNAIEERRRLNAKLIKADEEYEKMIQEAQQESKKITQEWLEKKEALIAEAGSIAAKRKEELLEDAHMQCKLLVDNAQRDAQTMQADLEKDFEQWVKQTTISVVKKLLSSDKDLQSSYLDTLIKEIKR